MTQAFPAIDDGVLIPASTYEQRAAQVEQAEAQTLQAIRNQKRSFWESAVTWLILLGLAWYTETSIAIFSSVAWLFFVSGYYMPGAAKTVARMKETLKIRVAYLTVEDAEQYVQKLPQTSLALQMINYRKGLENYPLENV